MDRIQAEKLFRELFLYVPPVVNPITLGGRGLVFVFLFFWGLKFIFSPIDSGYAAESFLHMVNLPFHEAGHLVFIPFGRLVTALGGTLGQLLMPLICLGTFIAQRDTFGASVCLWWTGESFMDIAPYIGDARALELVLLGGTTGKEVSGHDWEFILGHLGLLHWDRFLAGLAQFTGIILMVTALVWGAWLLRQQYKNL